MPKLTRVAPEIPVSNLKESLAYYLFQDSERHSPVSLHIFAEGLDGFYEDLQRRGATLQQGIVRKPWGNRDFRIADPAGNEIKFTEPLSR